MHCVSNFKMSDTREVQDPPYPLGSLPSSSSPDTSDLESPAASQDVIKEQNQVLASEQNGENAQAESQYITGFALWVNMISLMLSIFLIALDMVRTTSFCFFRCFKVFFIPCFYLSFSYLYV